MQFCLHGGISVGLSGVTVLQGSPDIETDSGVTRILTQGGHKPSTFSLPSLLSPSLPSTLSSLSLSPLPFP